MSIQFLKPASSPFGDTNELETNLPEGAETVTVDLDSEDNDGIVIVEKPEENQDQQLDSDDDDLTNYSERAQKRIKKLSYEFHSAERAKQAIAAERDAAVQKAQQLEARLGQMTGQSHQATTELAKSMQKSHEDAIASTQALLAKAHDDGNGVDIAKHTADLGRLNAELANIKNQAAYYDRAWKQQEAQRKAQEAQRKAQPQASGQQPSQVLAPRAQKWLNDNPWFTDPMAVDPVTQAKRKDAVEYNDMLIRSGKFTAHDDKLYQEVDAFINAKYPGSNDQMSNRQSPTSGQPPVAGVQTTGKNPSGAGKKSRTMELSPSELKIAQKFRLTPKQYALHKAKLEGNQS